MGILQEATLGTSLIQQVLLEFVLGILLGTRVIAVDGKDNMPTPETLQTSGGNKH